MSRSKKSAINNELIRKRKKKRNRKRILWLFVFITGIFILFSLKTNYFYVNKVIVEGNKYVVANEVVKQSGITENTNILYMNVRTIKDGILSNSYISTVKIKRKLPNTIVIEIEERSPRYIINNNDKIYILDSNLFILEVREDNPLGLPEIIGLDTEGKNLGEKATDSPRMSYFIENYTRLMDSLSEPIPISKIDLRDTLNIKLEINKLIIKLGDEEDLEDKLNKVINILKEESNYINLEGYIDVSFDGNPVKLFN